MPALAKRRKDPSLLELFRVGNISVDSALVARATGMAEAILEKDLADTLADLEFSETLAADLKTEAKRFNETADDQSSAFQGRVGNTASLEELERQARIVLGNMNTCVTNRFEDDPATLAAWETASRLERHVSTPSKPSDGDEPPSAAPANGTPETPK